MNLTIQKILPDDIALMEALLTTFGEAFDEVETYSGNRPSADYLRQLLKNDYFIAISHSNSIFKLVQDVSLSIEYLDS